MRCFYHPEVESVGICQECGKSACRQCIEDIEGTMTCSGCLARRQDSIQRQREAESQRQQAESINLCEQARKRIRWANILGLLGVGFFSVYSLMAFSQSVSLAVPGIILVPLGGYMLWSVYWGFVWFWPKWRAMAYRVRHGLGGWFLIAKPFTWLILLIFYTAFYLSIPLCVAIYYGMFGGGIVQYRKHQRLAAENLNS